MLALAVSPASAGDYGITIGAQPIGVSFLGNLQKPGAAGPYTFMDSAAGAHFRADVFFMSLFLDYQHFFKTDFDCTMVGIGPRFELPLGEISKYDIMTLHVSGQFGLIALTAKVPPTPPDPGPSFNTILGFDAQAAMDMDIALGEWLFAGFSFTLGGFYTTTVGFRVSVLGVAGLRL